MSIQQEIERATSLQAARAFNVYTALVNTMAAGGLVDPIEAAKTVVIAGKLPSDLAVAVVRQSTVNGLQATIDAANCVPTERLTIAAQISYADSQYALVSGKLSGAQLAPYTAIHDARIAQWNAWSAAMDALVAAAATAAATLAALP